MSNLQTYTGKTLDPMATRPEDLDVRDIAHSLALQCRFNGHCRQFYSVAEHSLRVSSILPPPLALWGLLHDAAEAYLCDLPRPIRERLPSYREAEEALLLIIAKAFGLSWPMPEAVREADDRLLLTEARDLMGFEEPPPWGVVGEPLHEAIVPVGPEEAERLFLRRFEELEERALVMPSATLGRLHSRGCRPSVDPGGAGPHPTIASTSLMVAETMTKAEERPLRHSSILATGGRNDPFLPHLRPLFAQATDIAILVAFVQESGVRRLRDILSSALIRGARIRVLTGDYLAITQADGLRDLNNLADLADEEVLEDRPGRLDLRIVTMESLASFARSFHPKAWIFLCETVGAAFVGSSNLSRTALTDGIEWNLRIDRDRDPGGFAQIIAAYESLWSMGLPVDEGWLAGYRHRARQANLALPPGELEAEVPLPMEPHAIQEEALRALARCRAEGHRRALVVLATGLGKTWLAAFDAQQVCRDSKTTILFLAHRVELLLQAERTFLKIFPHRSTSWFAGSRGDMSGDMVFATVPKLARANNLSKVKPRAFDYVIVDEVHHAEAPTWRRILAHLQPRFLLGLTATPERADGGDVLGLFDDLIVYRADIGEGIQRRFLVPFRYYGLPDDVDYAPIPWRNGQFDPEVLAEALQTHARMETLWRAWNDHPGRRTLLFCASIAHGRFVERWLSARGQRVAAVYASPGSADREESLEKLAQGRLDAICSVDLFNEGIDLPALDRVVMLRPTASPVLFLQQLGRGLRTHEETGKSALTVIDFVGNHHVFLTRLRTLLDAAAGAAERPTLRAYLDQPGRLALPEGCSINLDPVAIDLLSHLLPARAKVPFLEAYRDLKATSGRRPPLASLYHQGYNPRSLPDREGWFGFLQGEGDLTPEEERVWSALREWFLELEGSHRLRTRAELEWLQAFLDGHGFTDGMEGDEAMEGQRAWLSGPSKRKGRWFRLRDGRVETTFKAPEGCQDALAAMTQELLDYRVLRFHREDRAISVAPEARSVALKLIAASGRPIIRLERTKAPWIPSNERKVHLPDGPVWSFRFAKEYCNVAYPEGTTKNRLPELLRAWFGPAAGHPGTDFRVILTEEGGQLRMAPLKEAQILPFPRPDRVKLITFTNLRAAAGWAGQDRSADTLDEGEVRLPSNLAGEGIFALRAAGSSMEGLRGHIHDGDWLILRWVRGASFESLRGRIALVSRGDPFTGSTYHLKRILLTPEGLEFRSFDPSVPPVAVLPGDEPLALLERSLHPEALAPPPGTILASTELVGAFDLTEPPREPWGRVDGHLFIFLKRAPLSLSDPLELARAVEHRGSAETAFVLAQEGPDQWRYLGVASWKEEDLRWCLRPPLP